MLNKKTPKVLKYPDHARNMLLLGCIGNGVDDKLDDDDGSHCICMKTPEDPMFLLEWAIKMASLLLKEDKLVTFMHIK